MKKITAILCLLLIACLAGFACAEEVPSSDVYRPVIPETVKTLLGGKTYEAGIEGKECFGEDEDAIYLITVTASEETHFEAKDIENLKEHDILVFAPGKSIMVMEKTTDEFGINIKDGESVGYTFTRTEDGCYVARTDTENRFYTDLFTMKVPLSKDIRFLDWSNPENLEAPVEKGYDELLDLLLADTNFSPYNTRLTFDENGNLTEFLYTYSPWN
ncbi:MAG: hypothetical protein J6U01_09930 [Clostridia bacterium]|nr:hypothetical protein [Clostridia bacterium]